MGGPGSYQMSDRELHEIRATLKDLAAKKGKGWSLMGLIGVLIVGTLHALLRKRLNRALTNAETVFTKAIELRMIRETRLPRRDFGALGRRYCGQQLSMQQQSKRAEIGRPDEM